MNLPTYYTHCAKILNMNKELEKNKNRIIQVLIEDDETVSIGGQRFIWEGSEKVISPFSQKEYDVITIELTNSKKAFLTVPKNIEPNDVKIISHQLNGILLQKTLENE
jgi:hypothetical protein